MKIGNRGRKPRTGETRRIQIRLTEYQCEIHDRYSEQERSEIYGRALTTIYPKIPNAPPTPTIIRPKALISSVICRIVVNNYLISLVYPEKREDFRLLVRSYKYGWDGCWSRKFNENDDVIDRAAEISNQILLLGLSVQIDSEIVRERLFSDSFIPESFKRIMGYVPDPYKGWFTFEYPKNQDWYNEIMKITASKYTDGLIVVPPEQFLEVEDFAEINGFELTEKAITIIAQARTIQEKAIIFEPRRKVRKSKKKEINDESNPSNSVPAHLRDDD